MIPPAAAIAAVGVVVIGGVVLRSPSTPVPVASAWSTFRHRAKPAAFRPQQRHHRRLAAARPRRRPRTSVSWICLHALSGEEEEDAAIGDDDDDDDAVGGGGERRRKRDILKRTLGLGGSGGEPVRLNTDGLFEGMPGMDALLGAPASPLPDVLPDMLTGGSGGGSGGVSGSSGGVSASGGGNNGGESGFKKQGQRKEPDLLSPEEIRELDSKYDSIKSRSERLVSEELLKGDAGQFARGKEMGEISEDEAVKIVDYAVEEEKTNERRERDARRKRDLIAEWESEGRTREETVDRDLASSDDGGEEMLRNDGLTREIIENAQDLEAEAEDAAKKRRELAFYERQIRQRREVELSDYGAEEGADIDDVYEEALSRIRTSRSERLGPGSLGVLANSVALEGGRKYARDRRAEKEFLRELEAEASRAGVRSDDEVEAFFEAPNDYDEERMYRSIVRQIVDKRPEPSSEEMMAGEDEDGIPIVEYADAKARYKLTAKETVEAYKLLNLWREVRIEQDSMERALGMRDDGGARRPANKLEPFFLYVEDTEEKRQKEKEKLAMVLRRGLRSDDDVESASNEVLTKELLEGGITKERAARLIDKLLRRATDGAIKSSLEEMRIMILTEDGDVATETRDGTSSGPIDLSGVFRTSDSLEEEETKASSPSSRPFETASRTMPSWADEERREPPPPPPDTPFFSSSAEEVVAEDAAPPPPNTPFFQSTANIAGGEGGDAGGMFGTYEEQKLRRLADRVGARTEEDMEELRRNMEAIKEAEEMASAQLSDDDFDIAAASAKLGIDVDSLNFDDEGDDQIASIIGKRPVAGSSSTSSEQRRIVELDEYDESDDIIVDAEGHLKKMEGKREPDVADDVFRARTAGRRYKDRETRDADEAAFKEFVRMEEEAEKQFESTDNADGTARTAADDIDVDEYADDVMSEMGPRPRVRGRREDAMSREEVWNERKKESVFGEDGADDPFPVRGSQTGASSGGGRGGMPEWFRKEQEDQGIRVEDLDDDEFDEARREWEREERQRKADEYLKRKGEGISISDVLGREYFGPMDEPEDYKTTQSTFDGFEARKELLLGYTELTVEDINNVVDYKVDPLATGYNPYLSRVQRPYSEYVAIFRLEGVLADVIGMHGRAWTDVASKHGYRIESEDEVKQASLYKPEEAVREVFRWTDDILLVREIAGTHREALREAFEAWLESGGDAATASEKDVPFGAEDASGAPARPKATPSDEEMYSMYYLCWSKLAKTLDRPAPTDDQVYRGVAGRDWEVAVKDIFGWSEDPDEVYNIVVAYDEILQADYRVLLQKYGIDLDKMDGEEGETPYGMQFPDVSLKDGIREWLDTLREVDMPVAVVTHLDSSQLDAVLTAIGLAEYFPPDRRVSSSSDYSSERCELLGAALRAERRPDRCVVFDNAPRSANEAHEVGMKCVSFVDHYARYELLTADHSVGHPGDLDLMSFARLFDARTDLEPALELDVVSGMQREQRKIKTAFWDD